MPSFSDEFLQELHKKFLLEKVKPKDLETWNTWQKETHLKLTEQALTEQENKLQVLEEEIRFTKKVIKNLQNRIQLVKENK